MLIGSVLSTSNWISQLGQLSSTSSSANAGVDARSPVEPPPGGGMRDAITQALSKIGVGSSSVSSGSTAASASSSSTASTQDPAQALAAFMQTLMAALHAQSGQAMAGDGNDISGVKRAGHHRPNIESDLQSLIQKLASSSASSSGSGSSDASVSALQQSFQNLVGAVGGSSNATLANFLQAFASNMPSASAVGNVVSTRV